MITSVCINNYKCIENAEFQLKPLTIVTGLNSTGKSTFLQSILLPQMPSMNNKIGNLSADFDVAKCKFIKKDRIKIKVDYDNGDFSTAEISANEQTFENTSGQISYGKGLYYLAANRNIGNSIVVRPFVDGRVDVSDGLGSFVVYVEEKANQVEPALRRYEESDTLQAQVNYWLAYITGQSVELTADKVTEELMVLKFKSDGIPNILPSNMGTGVSFLAEVLITCLRAKSGDVVLIENPEIHLHPAAQAKIGEFLAFVANAGVQLVIETHCEHLINRVQYAVYKQELEHDQVVIYYKSTATTPFEKLELQRGGMYKTNFPKGFYDATLDEMSEMYG